MMKMTKMGPANKMVASTKTNHIQNLQLLAACLIWDPSQNAVGETAMMMMRWITITIRLCGGGRKNITCLHPIAGAGQELGLISEDGGHMMRKIMGKTSGCMKI